MIAKHSCWKARRCQYCKYQVSEYAKKSNSIQIRLLFVLLCVEADRKQTENTTALTASRGPVTWRQGMEGRGKREYGEYRGIRIWRMRNWQKKWKNSKDGDGNTYELQAGEGEKGRERKIQIWRNTGRRKDKKNNSRPSGVCMSVWMYVHVKWMSS